MNMLWLTLSVLWADREKMVFWVLRWHIAAVVGCVLAGRSLAHWLAG